ncbi:MAG: NgoFVII family restriction endonuclease [Anaerolineae bacterium]|nr:NgoFVII family restriction endonuclease [Anaerolineae bacterium]
MKIQIADNITQTALAVLLEAVKTSSDIRVAVAFISSDGLSCIMPAIEQALEADSLVEFLVGMDPSATDPAAITQLHSILRRSRRGGLLCFAPRHASAIYHPKMYLARSDQTATAIIGSSNLTRRGLCSNIEANVVITDTAESELIAEIYNTYYRLKYHPDRVIPDDEFLDLFAELCQRQRFYQQRQARDAKLANLKQTFINKAKQLERPQPAKTDLFGWLKLVYEALPEGEFTNQQIYEQEEVFRQSYPQNLNIRAKIRQQLQLLEKLHLIEHVEKGVWKKKA